MQQKEKRLLDFKNCFLIVFLEDNQEIIYIYDENFNELFKIDKSGKIADNYTKRQTE